MNDMGKERDSNIELYRIVLMLLIIAHHYVVNSGLLHLMYKDIYAPKSIFLFIIGAWGKIGINCFILITGYFMCKSKISINKFLKLFFEVEFYKVVIFLLFVITKNEVFSYSGLIKAMLPITSISRNFTGCYIVFYLFIPFINKLIYSLSKNEHRIIIGLLLLIYSIIGNIPKFYIEFNYVSLFIMIYFIGAYIRMYDFSISDKIVKCFNAGMIILCLLSVLLGIYLSKEINKEMVYFFVNDANKLLAVFTSIGLFLRFKIIKIKNNKWINQIAKSTFGVLLIHANSDAMRNFLWKKVLKNVVLYNSIENIIVYILHVFISIITVYIVCSLIDQLRIKFIEKILFNKIDNKLISINNRIEKIITR